MAELADLRVIHVGPRAECGGVGSYSVRFADTLRGHVAEVIEVRHGSPGSDTVADLRRRRRHLTELIAASDRPTVLHAEFSGGSVESFWPTAGFVASAKLAISATVHDPPGLVWWPARTRFLQRRRLLNHGLHFPMRAVSRRVERGVFGDRILFGTSVIGAQSLRERYPDATVHVAPLTVRAMPEMPAAPGRPRAVGLFGLVYRGKGFEHVERLRDELPDDIAIRIAGRGTENLPRRDGIEILGGLAEEEMAGYFASIRALVVPYGDRSPYGTAYPSSGVVADAISHLTPIVTTGHGALRELGAEGGAVAIDEGVTAEQTPAALAGKIVEIIDDTERLAVMAASVEGMRKLREPDTVIGGYVSVWSSVLEKSSASESSPKPAGSR
ncbi:glycosyltransferase [Gordonia polyisoprenivorans]|uniref:glycosyltransferase n=1 Tax=Gordonia polyisoprenivorans TaxID=84595 RepID=UPI0022345BF4|nr:glycosyltransferase [Gordonia polyisoprenivorans]